MSEAEFSLLIEEIRAAIMEPEDEFVPRTFDGASLAANDNEPSWPLVPFPDGWYAAC